MGALQQALNPCEDTLRSKVAFLDFLVRSPLHFTLERTCSSFCRAGTRLGNTVMAERSACTSENALLAFLENLVDPVLPSRRLSETPSESAQQIVGKQVHDVVLLYNYYQRKQNRLLNHLDFVEFCKFAVVLRPNLMAHMKFIRSSDDVMVDIENQLSLVEKKIMDACCISMSLDVTKDTPLTDGWPISKVAVFLVDTRKENCFLQFGTVTQGVWSVIEKDVVVSSNTSDTLVELKHQSKRKRVLDNQFEFDIAADETGFRKIAFSAVESASGIGQSHVRIIESHETYSLIREKNAVRFYIMQCNEPLKDGAIKTPIASVMESLQGPLVQECLDSWSVTRTVEYFHLLPYSRILSDWLAREKPSNGLQDHNSRLAVLHPTDIQSMGKPFESAIEKINKFGMEDASPLENDIKAKKKLDDLRGKPSNGLQDHKSRLAALHPTDTQSMGKPFESAIENINKFVMEDASPLENAIKSKKKLEDLRQCLNFHPNTTDVHQDMEVVDRSPTLPQNRSVSKTVTGKLELHDQQNVSGSWENGDVDHSLSDGKADTRPAVGVGASNGTAKENNAERNSADVSSVVVGRHQIMDLDDSAVILCKSKQSNHSDIDKVQMRTLQKVTNFKGSTQKRIAERTKEVSDHDHHVCDTRQSSFQEGNKLQQIIASKEKALSETALNVLFRKLNKLAHQQRSIEDEIAQCKRKIQMILHGGDDHIALMLDAVIEGANDTCQWRGIQETSPIRDPGHHYIGCERLSKAVTDVQAHCQELDAICCKHKWFLSSYHVFPIDNGFKAHLTLKGTDFELSAEGDIRGSPGEARDSAAEVMLGKLQGL